MQGSWNAKMSPGSILRSSNLFVVSRSDYDRTNSSSTSSAGREEFWRASFECNRLSRPCLSSHRKDVWNIAHEYVKQKKYHQYRKRDTSLFSKSCISKHVTFYCLIAFNMPFPTIIVLKPNPLDLSHIPSEPTESVAKRRQNFDVIWQTIWLWCWSKPIRFHTVSLVQRATYAARHRCLPLYTQAFTITLINREKPLVPCSCYSLMIWKCCPVLIKLPL